MRNKIISLVLLFCLCLFSFSLYIEDLNASILSVPLSVSTYGVYASVLIAGGFVFDDASTIPFVASRFSVWLSSQGYSLDNDVVLTPARVGAMKTFTYRSFGSGGDRDFGGRSSPSVDRAYNSITIQRMGFWRSVVKEFSIFLFGDPEWQSGSLTSSSYTSYLETGSFSFFVSGYNGDYKSIYYYAPVIPTSFSHTFYYSVPYWQGMYNSFGEEMLLQLCTVVDGSITPFVGFRVTGSGCDIYSYYVYTDGSSSGFWVQQPLSDTIRQFAFDFDASAGEINFGVIYDDGSLSYRDIPSIYIPAYYRGMDLYCRMQAPDMEQTFYRYDDAVLTPDVDSVYYFDDAAIEKDDTVDGTIPEDSEGLEGLSGKDMLDNNDDDKNGIFSEIVDALTGLFEIIVNLVKSLISKVEFIISLIKSIFDFLTDISGYLIGDIIDLNFDPLFNQSFNITTKFPFSIPFDLKNAFASLGKNIDNAPSFVVQFPETLNSVSFTIDLSPLQSYVTLIRTLEAFAFVFFLILLTRKILL